MSKQTSKSNTSKSSNSQNNTTMSNKNNTMVAKTTSKDFSFEPGMAQVASLSIHPLIEVIGHDVPDDVFIERASYFNYYERSVVTEDGYVITHPTDFLAAKESGVGELEVVVMKNAVMNDVIEFISFKNVWKHGKGRRKMYETIKFLTDFVSQQDKQWRERFEGKKTRAIVAEIIGVSDGTVQNIDQIGDADPTLLDKIDAGKITSSKALEQIRIPSVQPIIKLPEPVQPFESRKRYSQLALGNTPNVSNGEQAEVQVYKATFETDRGLIEFRMQGRQAAMFINNQHVTDVTHNVVSDKDYTGKREYCQHHTLLPDDDAFDVQFILKGIEKLIANQTKIAA